jgi:hypothetical protein
MLISIRVTLAACDSWHKPKPFSTQQLRVLEWRLAQIAYRFKPLARDLGVVSECFPQVPAQFCIFPPAAPAPPPAPLAEWESQSTAKGDQGYVEGLFQHF